MPARHDLIRRGAEYEQFVRDACAPLIGLTPAQIETLPCVVWPFGAEANGYAPRVNRFGCRPHVYACALLFGPRPAGQVTRHGPCHNRLCLVHVAWGTQAENVADMRRDGIVTRTGAQRLTEAQVREIRSLSGTESQRRLADRFGVSQNAVSRLVRGETWAWLS